MKMKNQTYDRLKGVALTLAPLATFVGAVCVIWGVPYSEQITATLAAFATMLGTMLKVSSDNYKATKTQDAFNNDGVEMFEVEDYEDKNETTEE